MARSNWLETKRRTQTKRWVVALSMIFFEAESSRYSIDCTKIDVKKCRGLVLVFLSLLFDIYIRNTCLSIIKRCAWEKASRGTVRWRAMEEKEDEEEEEVERQRTLLGAMIVGFSRLLFSVLCCFCPLLFRLEKPFIPCLFLQMLSAASAWINQSRNAHIHKRRYTTCKCHRKSLDTYYPLLFLVYTTTTMTTATTATYSTWMRRDLCAVSFCFFTF